MKFGVPMGWYVILGYLALIPLFVLGRETCYTPRVWRDMKGAYRSIWGDRLMPII